MKRKINAAVLHEVMFIPAIGQIKTTIDNQAYRGCDLALDGDVVIFKYKNVEAIIPITNFKVILVEPEAVVKAHK